MSNEKTVAIIFFVTLAIFVSICFYAWENFALPVANVSRGKEGVYTGEAYGLSFRYPAGYVLEEGERGDAHRGHYLITLIRQEDSAPRENSEGPTGISIDIYQNNIAQDSLQHWLTGSNESNYKLSDGRYSTTTVANVEAIAWHWSGLYEADAAAFRHNGNIISVTATYITPEDASRAAYDALLHSIKLLPPRPLTSDEAISIVKGTEGSLQDYPSDNLPPKRIRAMPYAGGWYIGFLQYGSGLPGILKASCYAVSYSKEVKKIGEFSPAFSAAGGPENLDLAACKASS